MATHSPENYFRFAAGQMSLLRGIDYRSDGLTERNRVARVENREVDSWHGG
jgi:hypothetical protein